MVAVRVVIADPKLPHQIVFRAFGPGGVGVSCNCLIRRRNTRMFGSLGHGRTAWEIYQAGPHDLRDGPLDRLVTGERQDYELC
jgi:hypothetical protein